jgi:hypothetical protein
MGETVADGVAMEAQSTGLCRAGGVAAWLLFAHSRRRPCSSRS